MRSLLLLVFFACLGLACATTAPEPRLAQITAIIQRDYPPDKYLSALDAAAELDEAKERALGSIAKIFAVRIEDDALFNQNVVTTQAAQERQQYLSRSTLTVARDDIDGIEIAQTWFDEDADLHYALAVLDKEQAARRWRQSAALLKDKIDPTIDAEQPAFRAIMLLHERQQWIGDYNRIAHRLQVVAPSSIYAPMVDDTFARVKRQCATIDFHITGNDASLVALAETSLAAQGMRRGSATSSLLRVDLSFGQEQIDQRANWHIRRQELTIVLSYAGLGERRIQWDIRDESTDSKTAARRLQTAKRHKIGEDLFPAVIAALNR